MVFRAGKTAQPYYCVSLLDLTKVCNPHPARLKPECLISVSQRMRFFASFLGSTCAIRILVLLVSRGFGFFPLKDDGVSTIDVRNAKNGDLNTHISAEMSMKKAQLQELSLYADEKTRRILKSIHNASLGDPKYT